LREKVDGSNSERPEAGCDFVSARPACSPLGRRRYVVDRATARAVGVGGDRRRDADRRRGARNARLVRPRRADFAAKTMAHRDEPGVAHGMSEPLPNLGVVAERKRKDSGAVSGQTDDSVEWPVSPPNRPSRTPIVTPTAPDAVAFKARMPSFL